MKQILFLSGKGGTGKTNFASSFAILASDNAVAADCDVDAADMHLVLKPTQSSKELFYSGYIAEINQDICTNCGKCISICNFDAIISDNTETKIIEQECEGCGYCTHICPQSAITMKSRPTGHIYRSKTNYGIELIHANLFPSGENSGKLVSEVKKIARKRAEELNKDYVIIDGSPGIGCPVAASLSGVNYVVIITEATMSAFSDLKRLHELIAKLRIKAGCIINKADINQQISENIIKYLKENNIDYLDSYKFDTTFVQANRTGIPVIEYGTKELREKFKSTWQKILNNISK